MKIALASDLHLEFGDVNITNDEDAEVLLLSGDIFVAQDLHDHPPPDTPYDQEILKILGSRQLKAKLYRDFLSRVSNEFSHVIYIAGNHEFYHGKFYGSLDVLENECAKFSNVYFLENQTKKINDISFIGCTLWTDMNKGDPLTLHSISNIMNDFRIIRNDKLGYTSLRPAHVMSRHRKSVDYIRAVIADNFEEKFVVVGHHAPSSLSIHDEYKKDTITNGSYYSDLSEFILDHPQIKLWTHGHTHHPFDYTIGECRIVCNPRGYVGYEKQSELFKLQYLEI